MGLSDQESEGRVMWYPEGWKELIDANARLSPRENTPISKTGGSAPDVAKQPHYTRLSPQPIEVIEKWGLDFHLANAIKYIARAGQKPGASAESDLRKALFYIRRKLGEQELA